MNWAYLIFDTLVLPAVLITASLIAFKFRKYIISMVCTGALIIWTPTGIINFLNILIRLLHKGTTPHFECSYPIVIGGIIIGVAVTGYCFYRFYKAAKYHGFESLK